MRSASISLRASDKSAKGGLSDSGRRRINKLTGSKLKPPVTESNPTGRRKARKASFCGRMRNVEGPMEDSKGRPTRKALALRRWKC
jgi:hypothetical protein